MNSQTVQIQYRLSLGKVQCGSEVRPFVSFAGTNRANQIGFGTVQCAHADDTDAAAARYTGTKS
jgi:hypothetical protein